MKRQFVGAIIENTSRKILLVKRSEKDDLQGGNWSLPAGEIESGEDHISAIKREVLEEVGLNIKVNNIVCKIERDTWNVLICSCDIICGEAQPIDQEISDVSWFDISELPENIVLEALISILKHAELNGKINLPYYVFIEKIFSAIYYSYIDQVVSKFSTISESDLLFHTIRKTPYRKFKSAIPSLLSSFSSTSLLSAALSELSFAIFTVLDDICDARSSRYDSATAISSFGVPVCTACLLSAVNSISRRLKELGFAEASIADFQSAISECGVAQANRFLANDQTLQSFYEMAYRRTRFLEVIWRSGLSLPEQVKEENIISSNYRSFAILGQMLNDYYDMKEDSISSSDGQTRWSDIQLKYLSFSSSLIANTLPHEESAGFFRDIFGSVHTNQQSKDKLQHIFDKYQIEKLALNNIGDIFCRTVASISNSDISDDKKNVLLGWAFAQFAKYVPDYYVDPVISNKPDLDNFIDAITRLTYSAH